jgi:putative NADH-flavin reductase
MKISIFGATGRTGQLLVERALRAGHEVTALARTPAAVQARAGLRVVKGDVYSVGPIAEVVAGADAVFSALGARSLGKDDAIERGVPLIVEAMKAARVKRLIVLGSAGALDTAMDKQLGIQKWIVENIVYKTVLKWPVEAQRVQYRILAASGLDWTMAMPPMLTDFAASGKVREDADALPPGALYCSRADVADWMFRQLGSDQWVRRAVYISR